MNQLISRPLKFTCVLSALAAISWPVGAVSFVVGQVGAFPNLDDGYYAELPAGQDSLYQLVELNPGGDTEVEASLTLSTGEIRARASTNTTGEIANIRAVLEDTIHIDGDLGTGMMLAFDVSINGSFVIVDRVTSSNAASGVFVINIDSLGQPLYRMGHLYRSNTCAATLGFPDTVCRVDSSFSENVFAPFFVDDAHRDINFSFSLFASAVDGAVSDFSHTVGIQLNLPDGLSFTSDSGLFLTGSQVTPVPEPSTYVLMLAGLGALAYVARRRKGSY